jgi:hypothetical protein
MSTNTQNATASLERRAGRTERFSALDLKDNVVVMALFDQLVTEEQVATLWHVWKMRHLPFYKEPFWRLLTLIPGTEPESIFAQAARVGDIEEGYISPSKAVPLIKKLAKTVPAPVWAKMLKMRLLPIAQSGYSTGKTRLVFATHDPTNPLVKELLERLRLGEYELRYAPMGALMALVEEAFPAEEKAPARRAVPSRARLRGR